MSGTPVATLAGTRDTIAGRSSAFYAPYGHQGFPGQCLLADGRVMAFIDSKSTHAAPVGKNHAYRIRELDGTWGAPVALPWGNTYWNVGIPTRLQHGPNAGKILVAVWGYPPEYASPHNDHRSYTFLSNTDDPADGWAPGTLPAHFTDATLTQIGPHAYPRTTVESRAAEDTNGDLYIVTMEGSLGASYGFAGSRSSTKVFKMAAGTSTWVYVATAQLSTNTGGEYPPPETFEEQYIIRLQNGEYLVTCRQDENAATYVRHTHILRSTDSCASWTDEGRMNGTTLQSASRAPVVQTESGRLFLHHRVLKGTGAGAVSWQGSYYTSDDNGTTWSDGRRLKDGAAESTTGSEDAYIYGMSDPIDATTVAVTWSDEDAGSGTLSDVFFNTFTVPTLLVAAGYGNTLSSGYGTAEAYTPLPASLTIDPASTAWEQIDTSIIVRVTADGPASVPAVVTSTHGGLVRFRGTDASLFEVSLDGTTWASTVDVPIGETDVFLRVTPETPGTTLLADIGVPV